VQVLTETKNKIIVHVAATQKASDQQQFEPAVERVQEAGRQKPERMIVDGGYLTRQNLEAAERQSIEEIGPELEQSRKQARNCAQSLRRAGIAGEFGPSAFVQIEDGKALQCPAGRKLQLQNNAARYRQYVSNQTDCEQCAHQRQCSPKGRRTVKIQKSNEVVRRYTERMREEASRKKYQRRGRVAEFPHAWLKEKLGLRRFHVRGRAKAEIEAWWGALTYNVQQWFRLVWRPRLVNSPTVLQKA
jgi:hypothetical protein